MKGRLKNENYHVVISSKVKFTFFYTLVFDKYELFYYYCNQDSKLENSLSNFLKIHHHKPSEMDLYKQLLLIWWLCVFGEPLCQNAIYTDRGKIHDHKPREIDLCKQVLLIWWLCVFSETLCQHAIYTVG